MKSCPRILVIPNVCIFLYVVHQSLRISKEINTIVKCQGHWRYAHIYVLNKYFHVSDKIFTLLFTYEPSAGDPKPLTWPEHHMCLRCWQGRSSSALLSPVAQGWQETLLTQTGTALGRGRVFTAVQWGTFNTLMAIAVCESWMLVLGSEPLVFLFHVVSLVFLFA